MVQSNASQNANPYLRTARIAGSRLVKPVASAVKTARHAATKAAARWGAAPTLRIRIRPATAGSGRNSAPHRTLQPFEGLKMAGAAVVAGRVDQHVRVKEDHRSCSFSRVRRRLPSHYPSHSNATACSMLYCRVWLCAPGTDGGLEQTARSPTSLPALPRRTPSAHPVPSNGYVLPRFECRDDLVRVMLDREIEGHCLGSKSASF